MIFKFIKKLFKKTTVVQPACRYCKYKQDAYKSWYCKCKVKVIQGRAWYTHICGETRPNTAPSWCPLIK